jgi:hypothetical protein
MATIKRPRGRMTKPLATPYEVGDVVQLMKPYTRESEPPVDPVVANAVAFALSLHGIRMKPAVQPRVGDLGVIHKILIADPNEGNDTFLVLLVKWSRIKSIRPVTADEIAPAALRKSRSKHEVWLRRQLASLEPGA